MLSGEWFRVRHWVFDPDVVKQRVVVDTVNALDHVQGFAMGESARVKPGLIVETDRVHNQRVAFPFANRITGIGRVQIFEVLSIQIDLAQRLYPLANDHDARGHLEDFHGDRHKHEPRDSLWQAAEIGIVRLRVRLFEFRLSPRRQRGASVWKQLGLILGHLPDARNVRYRCLLGGILAARRRREREHRCHSRR